MRKLGFFLGGALVGTAALAAPLRDRNSLAPVLLVPAFTRGTQRPGRG